MKKAHPSLNTTQPRFGALGDAGPAGVLLGGQTRRSLVPALRAPGAISQVGRSFARMSLNKPFLLIGPPAPSVQRTESGKQLEDTRGVDRLDEEMLKPALFRSLARFLIAVGGNSNQAG